jgi:hypothetical protein
MINNETICPPPFIILSFCRGEVGRGEERKRKEA